MASESGHPGICAHCGGEVAEDGFAVKMAGTDDEQAEEPPPAEDSGSSGFLAALATRRRSSGSVGPTSPQASEEGA